MRRILITVSYDGTAYCGWQRQLNGDTVQAQIERALKKATGEDITITGASRTDAGVHAMGQCAHFDTDSSIPPEKYPFVLNRFLPRDVRVLEGRGVCADFHARFSAKGKTYTYRIHNARQPSALFRDLTAFFPYPLDTDKMHAAAQRLLGTHDFAAFAASGGHTKTTIRTIDFISVTRESGNVTLIVHGNAFLYNMVRIIAGTLMDIGTGKLPPDCFTIALDTLDRLSLGVTAPASGLELTKVDY